MADRVRTQESPRTAVVWAVLRAELRRRAGEGGLQVLDVGGGTGGFAVPLAADGHRVTVVDPSPDALAALGRRAAEQGVADLVTAVQGDTEHLDELVKADSVDLVLCHSVLEVVEQPAATLAAVATVLRAGGCASLLVANRAAAVLSRAFAGHYAAAHAVLADDAGRAGPGDTLLRRFDVDGLTALLTGAGLVAERVHGVRVVADLAPGTPAESEPRAMDALLALELATADRPPYRDLATQLHVLARRP